MKGLYHINAVDCVTQFELVATCERLSEAYLMPVLAVLLDGFPFAILGFHADNGSEFIHHTVAKLLERLRVEDSPTRARGIATSRLLRSPPSWSRRNPGGSDR